MRASSNLHTFASLPLQNGESIVYAKERLGHASIQITVDTYGHLIPGANRGAVNRLDDVNATQPGATRATGGGGGGVRVGTKFAYGSDGLTLCEPQLVGRSHVVRGEKDGCPAVPLGPDDVFDALHVHGALFGHSYGAGCAMGAATLTDNVSRVVLYEPGLGIAYPPGWLDANEKALAAGDAEGVIRAVLIDILEMSEDDVETRRSTPQWSAYLGAAATVLREARTEHNWVYRPGALDRVHAPTLVLVGTETSPALMQSTLRAVAAIPGARTHVLGGHGHLACMADPGLIASIIMQFVSRGGAHELT